jgi:hypothetical protein
VPLLHAHRQHARLLVLIELTCLPFGHPEYREEVAMFSQLENYKNPKLILNSILQALYTQVTTNRPIAHFFMNVHMDALIADVQKFSHFAMEQPESHYRDPMRAQKSSMPSIQVSSSVFEEVHKILVQILKDQDIAEDQIPRLSFEILEIVEESRAQFSDTIMMALKMEDVTQDSLLEVFKRFKFEAKLAGKNEINVESGIDIPIIVKIRAKDKCIILIGKAVSVENSKLRDVEEIAAIAKEKYPIFPVKAVEDDDDWPFLLMEKSFSYEDGVPLRLLFRLAKSFSTAFYRNVKCDSQKVLACNVANR